MKKISKEQMGTNSFLMVFLILKRGDSYGYAIMNELKEISEGRLIWKEGSLYPVLKKMETKKLIKSYWNVKDHDRPRKYYKILKKGIDELNAILEEQYFIEKIKSSLKAKIN